MELFEASDILAALGHETRLGIFRYLVQQGPEGVPAGIIGEAFELPGATLSHHLNSMRQAGIIKQQRQGRSLLYTADFQHMNELMGFLLKDCCKGQCTP